MATATTPNQMEGHQETTGVTTKKTFTCTVMVRLN
jgi:hypothetical protein